MRHGLVPIPVIFEQFQEISVKELGNKETYWISKAREAGANLTNICDGGQGLSGYVPTQAHKDAISRFHKGKKRPAETGLRISEAKRGKKRGPPSEEQREKQRLSMLGKNKGHKSEETRAKISMSLKGRPPALKGKKMSERGRENLRLAWVRRKNDNSSSR